MCQVRTTVENSLIKEVGIRKGTHNPARPDQDVRCNVLESLMFRLSAVNGVGGGDGGGGISNDSNERWCYSMSLASVGVAC